MTVALVTVTTNRFPPLLDLPAYITSVLETQSYGVEIITVTASDNDLTVSLMLCVKYLKISEF